MKQPLQRENITQRIQQIINLARDLGLRYHNSEDFADPRLAKCYCSRDS